MTSKVEKALAQLRSRPEHISQESVDKDIVDAHMAYMQGLPSQLTEKPFKFTGTFDSQDFLRVFKFITAVKVFSKNADRHPKETPIFIYHHSPEDSDLNPDHYFLCFGQSGRAESLGKIVLKTTYEEYPDYTGLGMVCIVNLTNTYAKNYRVGTLFVQIAIEHSLRLGLGGRVKLSSIQDEFYEKLGFTYGPADISTPMHLSLEVIKEWKKIIAKRPIILSSEEVAQYCEVKSEPEAKEPKRAPNNLTFFMQPRARLIGRHNSDYTKYALGLLALLGASTLFLFLLKLQMEDRIEESSPFPGFS